MIEFAQVLVSGLGQGAIYALMALGLAVVYRATTVLNFMHGENFMLGAVVAYLGIEAFGLPYLVAGAIALAVAFAVGLAIDKLVYERLLKAPHLTQVFATIAVSFMLLGSARLVIGDERPMPPLIPGPFLDLAGVRANPQDLVTASVLVVTALVFFWMFERTELGLILKASAQSPRGAALVGIDTRRIAAVMWGVGGALGAISGILAAPFLQVSADMGSRPLILGFAAMTLGGFGSLPGAIVGGLLVGIAEVAGAYYVSTALGDAAGFVVIILVLIVRPAGLFGTNDVT